MIAIACDHAGYALKQKIISYLKENNIAYQNFGCNQGEKVDYPIYAEKVAIAIQSGSCKQGILICGTGIGISIAANRKKGVRAALCHDCYSAQAARLHNDANVLALGGRVIGEGLALKIVDTFLHTEFSKEERHKRRILMLEEESRRCN